MRRAFRHTSACSPGTQAVPSAAAAEAVRKGTFAFPCRARSSGSPLILFPGGPPEEIVRGHAPLYISDYGMHAQKRIIGPKQNAFTGFSPRFYNSFYRGDGSSSFSRSLSFPPKYRSRVWRARSRPPNPKAIATANITAPNAIENAETTVWRASPTCSSAMETARMEITNRTNPLHNRGERYPAFTAVSNAARDRKFAASTPTNKIRMATKICGNSWNSREICSCSSATCSTLMPSSRIPAA